MNPQGSALGFEWCNMHRDKVKVCTPLGSASRVKLERQNLTRDGNKIVKNQN